MTGRNLARFKVCVIPIIVIFVVFWLLNGLFQFPKRDRTVWHGRGPVLDKKIKRSNGSEMLVWPEDDSSDRILAQLSLTIPDGTPMKTIFDFSGAFKVPLGSDIFLDHDCNIRQCSFVDKMSKADAVLFRDSVTISREHVSPEQIWILYTLESPYHCGSVSFEGTVNWTATYRRDSELVTPYAKWVYFDDNIKVNDSIKKNFAEGKSKKVAFFVSNCKSRNDRLEYANELSKYIEVDIYGRCGSKTCSRTDRHCFEMLQSEYKFYLAFENSNCRDYITEKFYENALLNDVLPVVMGAYPDDYNAGPEFSYVHVDNFPNVEELANFLLQLDADDYLYNRYFSWKGTGEFINTKFFCRLCALLHTPRQPKSYSDFKGWWKGDGICTADRWIV